MTVNPRVLTFLRWTAAIIAILVGSGMFLLAVTVGHCSAFGGRCPAEPPALFDDDVFKSAFFGGALVTAGALMLAAKPWRRLAIVLPAALVAGFILGVLARSYAAGA
jgi:hypothetical protein